MVLTNRLKEGMAVKEKPKQWDTHVAADIRGWLLRVEAGMGHLNDVLQLAGLLLHLGSQEECGRSDDLDEEKAAHHQLDSCHSSPQLQLLTSCHTKLTFLWNLVKDWTM